jgi:hydrogenase maturation protease
MNKALIVGFGNVYRRDDGVGAAVVNAVRQKLGRPALGPEDDGFDDLGHDVDTVLLHQLVPELAETLAGYALVVFVDAHAGASLEDVREEWLQPCYRTPFISHQMHPCTVLSLIPGAATQPPAGVLLSVRGHDFDFGEGLSPQTAALVPAAVRRIEELLQEQNAARASSPKDAGAPAH